MITKQQWAILGVLGVAVLCLYCVGGVIVLQTLSAPPVTPDLAAFQAEPSITPTTFATPTPTDTPTALPTATWVLAPPPTVMPTATWVLAPPQAGTTVVGTRAPLTPNVTPAATATRPPTLQPTGPLMTAWSKTQKATTYRIEFQIAMSGNLPDLPPAWQLAQGMPVLGLTAAVNGKDAHMKMQGLLAMLLTGNPAQALEIMTIGGKIYLRGPAPMLGAPEAKWYVLTGQSNFSMNYQEMLETPSDPTIDWNSFKKTTTEVLDGRRCDVYMGDKNVTLKFFDAIATTTGQGQDSLGNITNATSKFWVCDDGYLHQLLMNVEGASPNKPSEKVSFQVRLHAWDFNTNIKLTAPATAVPLPNTSFNFFFATPTRTK
jgi:hypothetical protein